MKKLLLACAAGLALTLVPSQVHALGLVDVTGFGVKMRWYSPNGRFFYNYGGGLPAAGPWYLYWPYEAHFANPAPYGFPYWPTPQTLPQANMAPGGPPGTMPYGAPYPQPNPPPPAQVPGAPIPPPPSGFQPTGYYPLNYVQPAGYSQSAVPSYWYGR